MSIKATQPEIDALIFKHSGTGLNKQVWFQRHEVVAIVREALATAQAEPTQSEYDRVYGIVRYWSNRANYLEDQLAAKVEPAEAKTAAVDGMTDAEIYAWWASENGLEDCNMCKPRSRSGNDPQQDAGRVRPRCV
jgi:hypothetical protein